MGCWGIKALESDEGLDIIIELEKILPKDGHLQLEKLSGGSKCWDAYGDVCEDGKVHTKANGVGRGHYGVSGWGAV